MTPEAARHAAPALATAHDAPAVRPIESPAARQLRAIAEAPTQIVLSGVDKTYHDGEREISALRGIDLQIKRGEIFGVIGRSGAGKSSLIRTINGLESVSGGRVDVDGVDIAALGARELMRTRRRIGMIFQHFNLLSSRTVFGNLALPARAAGVSRHQIRARAEELLALVGLADKRDVYPAQLSGGQKQRAGIARALMLEPQILLCDEATSALDPETTESILALLRRINRELDLTIVLITHEMAVIRAICDRVVVLENGEVVEQGPVWRIFGQPAHAATRSMLSPLAEQLPAGLQEIVRKQSAGPGDGYVVALSYRGETPHGRPPDLSAIGQAVGAGVHWLHGSIERIQGHPIGRIVIAIENGVDREARVRDALRGLGAEVTEIGYVRLSRT